MIIIRVIIKKMINASKRYISLFGETSFKSHVDLSSFIDTTKSFLKQLIETGTSNDSLKKILIEKVCSVKKLSEQKLD